MVYNTEGLPLQGLTGGYNDERRVEFIIKSPKIPQTIYIEVSANGTQLLIRQRDMLMSLSRNVRHRRRAGRWSGAQCVLQSESVGVS